MRDLDLARIYLRGGRRLTRADRVELEAYYSHLRNFYDIAPGRAVFGDQRSTKPTRSSPNHGPSKRMATGKNRADHPWRGTL